MIIIFCVNISWCEFLIAINRSEKRKRSATLIIQTWGISVCVVFAIRGNCDSDKQMWISWRINSFVKITIYCSFVQYVRKHSRLSHRCHKNGPLKTIRWNLLVERRMESSWGWVVGELGGEEILQLLKKLFDHRGYFGWTISGFKNI
jgi:hypothetical protein